MKIINLCKDIPTQLITLSQPKNCPIQTPKAPKDSKIGQGQRFEIDQGVKKDFLNILYKETPKQFLTLILPKKQPKKFNSK